MWLILQVAKVPQQGHLNLQMISQTSFADVCSPPPFMGSYKGSQQNGSLEERSKVEWGPER